ncbi:mitochondrial carrier [Basidiobolus meristosporus CBS 931.73]|uniref:Mitochondrial carrier n=1 Tax=Basidiobolus meristosporus CBS 931.73 TaxID=1314790 RepID=A0A1Y1YC29_9FUNG|nr:mitochondrial carrier [Basidiobolus meristosporus CBS 931.73]|eukprot:ORX95611.1 mitochondrial carrier [Basidiobolus meristosporus CBS 931.73]
MNAKGLAAYAALKYFSTAIANPFEVGQTLLQVQYLPKDDEQEEVNTEKEQSDDPYAGEELDEDDMEYFDVQMSSTIDPSSGQEKKQADHMGYLIRKSVYDESTRPAYQLPPLDTNTWGVIKALVRQPTEGWRSLWKGQFTNWLYDMTHLFLQPSLEGMLNDSFDLYDDTIPLVHLDNAAPNVATLVASHLAVGVLLSPLEVVRTRLIVQTSSKKHRKYQGPFHCLRTIIAEEGFGSLYWSHNLLPTVIYHTISPLISNTIPLVIERVLQIDPLESPFVYSLVELAFNTLDILITLPLDTIRKRLQCQIRTQVPGKSFETVVETRRVPYTGMIDCGRRILTEESVRRPQKKAKKSKDMKGVQTWNWRGLYPGVGMHLSSNLAMFAVNLVNGIQTEEEW